MFKITSEDKETEARVGILQTQFSTLETPVFMPVATKGAVKFMDFQRLADCHTQCMISNSYILCQRPGLDIVHKAGGLHSFYGWKKGIFTDSGGFQTLDDNFKQRSTADGVRFRSPFDGKTELITPERSMEIQTMLGADVVMCFDDVPKHDDTREVTIAKTDRTHAWAQRCKEKHDLLKVQYDDGKNNRSRQLLFGIAQGGMHPDLRKESAEFISSIGFDGHALGGLAIGESMSTMYDMIKVTVGHLPKEKPRYLMGVGSPETILRCIGEGVDFFDSTFPTQNARHSTLFTWDGKLRLDRREFMDDLGPIDPECGCYVCKNYSRAYIQHQLRQGEAAGKILATHHNIFWVQQLIEKAKEAIREGRYQKFMDEMLEKY